jgi:hypothetical protein
VVEFDGLDEDELLLRFLLIDDLQTFLWVYFFVIGR